MSASLPASKPVPAVPVLLPVKWASLSDEQLTSLLVAPPAQLLIDCGQRLLPQLLGVCDFVTQLLQLHQLGTRIGLCNMHPELRRCLQQLQLKPILHWNDDEQVTGAAHLALR